MNLGQPNPSAESPRSLRHRVLSQPQIECLRKYSKTLDAPKPYRYRRHANMMRRSADRLHHKCGSCFDWVYPKNPVSYPSGVSGQDTQRATTARFCEIVAGDTNASIVFEDEVLHGFLDSRPLFPGHCLLIPKAHFETFADVPEG